MEIFSLMPAHSNPVCHSSMQIMRESGVQKAPPDPRVELRTSAVMGGVIKSSYLFFLSYLFLSYHTSNLSSYLRSYLILSHGCQAYCGLQHSTVDIWLTHIFNIVY